MYKFICVIIMIITTYIPRALPFALIKNKINNRFIKSVLYYIPFAVMACLTFPSIMYFSSNIYLSIIGTACAIILSFFNMKLYLVAVISVAVVFGASYLF